MDTPAQTPQLSVVVVTLVGPETLARCLEALDAQIDPPALEIIVPLDARLGDPGRLRQKYPHVQFLQAPGRKTYAQLRCLGICQARGPVVAVTEDHCRPQPDWCAQIVRLHAAAPHAAIGGAVEKEAPDSPLNWSFYFADYLRYSLPFEAGRSHALTDLNVTYKRAAMDRIAPVWAEEFHENAVHAALEAAGETLWLAPEVVVRQQRPLTLGHAVWYRYAFGRLFASTRVAGAPPAARLKLIALAPLVPLLLVARIAGLVNRKCRWKGEFVRALPAVALVSLVWGWGELIGYVTGRPEAALSAGGK